MNDQIQKTIIEELGIGDLSQEKQDEILAKMTEVILKRIFVETMEKLTPVDQEQYSQMVEKEETAPEEVEKFLLEKIPAYDEMVKKIIADFRQEMINEN